MEKLSGRLVDGAVLKHGVGAVDKRSDLCKKYRRVFIDEVMDIALQEGQLWALLTPSSREGYAMVCISDQCPVCMVHWRCTLRMKSLPF